MQEHLEKEVEYLDSRMDEDVNILMTQGKKDYYYQDEDYARFNINHWAALQNESLNLQSLSMAAVFPAYRPLGAPPVPHMQQLQQLQLVALPPQGVNIAA